MKYVEWSAEKNTLLVQNRQVSFEDVLSALSSGRLIKTIAHPNQKKYNGQQIFVVSIRDYIYLVPFVETEEKIFLKTIIPSRKATKKFLRKDAT
ncbi:MAG: toxin [Candidatus Pacebacteria bacterium RIFCSPHIGHO2_01_FULL_46_16]|nr:MAG: toxin [Candidatus Pacebacteria bacterium RIFCSPHIGHO2_01_FULL_46_16]OGJ20527.1 MAG: toxin [Candidatus Pacebacteria bacterium RIFCSPHIGHO2_02_FULL_46_9]OGJ39195.1 MAG: toxin [Candidatus Pacebacteria bacterium RIFCSPLOWO2_01_FULL_47_12]